MATREKRFLALALAIVSLSLGGCGNANWSSIYRSYPIDLTNPTATVLIDAKQRAIISMQNSSHQSLVCAEPSPDAFSAVGQSLAASGSFNPSSDQVSLALSLALAESAGELRRARTIQLLRDGLFVACEGFIDGALDAGEYQALINKYADATVTLLAIEQITPQAVSPPITLTSPSTSATITNQPQPQTVPQGNPQPGAPSNAQPGTPANPQLGAPANAQPGVPANKPNTPGAQLGSQQGNQGNGQGAGATTGGGTASPQQVNALPPPTPEAVNAVSLLVSDFLRHTVENECITAYTKGVGPGTSPTQLEAFCDSVFQLGATTNAQTAVSTTQPSQGPGASQQNKTNSSPNQSQPPTLFQKTIPQRSTQ